MKITFIVSAIGKKKGQKYIGTWKMEPLTIAVLKSLTPSEYETEFFDDRIEEIDTNTQTDLVLISVETYTARRSYGIAEKFRQRGIPVVMGGYHATLMPEETIQYCDAVVTGNAESVWVSILDDAKNKQLKPKYEGTFIFSDKLPDRSIFGDKKYLPITLIETGRGCNFVCNFCAIAGYYKTHYFPKPISLVIDEIKQAKHKLIFFVDDNIIANPTYALEMFKAIAPLNIKWAGQGTINIAKNPELLYWMKKSGCVMILIGFESLDNGNLKQMAKEWRTKIGDQDELVQTIHKAGINIYATFVFGFDNDNEQTVKDALEFSQKHHFFVAAFNHLLPFPGTPYYDSLKEKNAFTVEKWWLDDNYHYGQLAFKPSQIDANKLSLLCVKARNDFFSIFAIIKRGLVMLARKTSLKMFFAFWVINFSLRKEVNQKFGLPMGDGLEEKKR